MDLRFLTAPVRRFVAACLTSAAIFAGSHALADAGPSHGELAAAVRSAKLPCSHVIQVKAADENQWSVECNSGTFLVTRGQDGRYTVLGSN